LAGFWLSEGARRSRFARVDGQPWVLAGLWSEWTDPVTGELVPSYTMLT
jgi:putative SOS response-associated peptidase YedK